MQLVGLTVDMAVVFSLMTLLTDVSPDHLVELEESYYSTKVVVSQEEAHDIEMDAREQSDCDLWKAERLKRITASKVGTITKML